MALSGARPSRVLALLAAAVVVALLWWTQGDGTEPAAPGPTDTPAARATTGSPSGEPTGSPSTDPASGLPVVAADDLPAEARDVLARIDAGGPFKYPRDDGGVFENREELLPEQPIGYYREYTVESAPDVRGPMRIVTGGEAEYYWTEDHYRSFSMIAR